MYINSNHNLPDYSHLTQDSLELILPEGESLVQDYGTSNTYSVLVRMDNEGLESLEKGYTTDQFYSKVLNVFQVNGDKEGNYLQYQVIKGLIYFKDWNGNLRLCGPDSLRVEVMSEVHNILTESAHGGHAKTYNCIASTYYWPKMSQDIKKYVSTCDICQKAKPQRHPLVGLLQPIPIPSQPFEVVSIDFIPELPLSSEFDNILVIVDQLTKYTIFIPTTISVTEVKTAKLFFPLNLAFLDT
jgi:hypothetical protein